MSNLMTTATVLKTQILTKADEDGEFRALLIADPKAAIASEIGMDIPEGFDIVVHEDSGNTAHLVLPPSPELTDAELKLVAEGNFWNDTMHKEHVT